jgi:hypothetical protein
MLNIPRDPYYFYRNKGWNSWSDWLGTVKAKHRKNFLLYSEAKLYVDKFLKQNNFKNSYDWRKYCKSGLKPKEMPFNPDVVYANSGWISWGDWLGAGYVSSIVKSKNYLSYDDAFNKNILDIKKYKITTKEQWIYYCKNNKINNDIPNYPHNTYLNKGWVSYNSWLGVEKKYKINDNFFKKWSSDMAYIFGFWFADGNIFEKRNSFNISQSMNDKYLLEQILEKMGANYQLLRSKKENLNDCFSFTISNKIIYSDIIKLGGIPKKV